MGTSGLLMDDEYAAPRWRYGLTYRPLAYAQVPDGWIVWSWRPHRNFQFGTVDYPFELPASQAEQMSLTFVEYSQGDPFGEEITVEEATMAISHTTLILEPKDVAKVEMFTLGKHYGRSPEVHIVAPEVGGIYIGGTLEQLRALVGEMARVVDEYEQAASAEADVREPDR